MKIGDFGYRLFLRQSPPNKKKLYTIYCKLAHGSGLKVITTGIKVPKDAWFADTYRIKDSYQVESYLLESWKFKLHKKLLEMHSSGAAFTLMDVVHFINPGSQKQASSINIGFVEVFRIFTKKAKQQIGTEYTRATVTKFDVIASAFEGFLQHTYKTKDIAIDKIKLKHLLEYEEYASIVLKHKTATINKSIQRLKQVIKFAIGHDYLQKDPWILHKSKAAKTEIVFLSKEQLQKLSDIDNLSDKLNRVRDCFLFSCYSGLAYAELFAIKADNIITRRGIPWIDMSREKTQRNFLIPMLPPAQKIWDKYNGMLPVLSNQKYNAYLKELADRVGIDIKLTSHIARKTFTTTVLLQNNVPLKVVSAMLGHSHSAITEKYYARVTNDLLDQHVSNLVKLFDKKL